MTVLDSYRIDLPIEWASFPVDSSDTLYSRFNEARNDDHWEMFSRTEQRQAELAVQQLDAYLGSGGCDLAAFYYGHDEPADPADTPSAIFAGLTLSTMTAEQLAAPGRVSIDLLETAFLQPSPDGSATLLEPPKRIELSVGPAVQVKRVLSFGAGADTKFFNAACLVPIGPDFETVCVLTLTTPNVAVAPDFSVLFDAIARTLRFYREGEPTDL